MCKCFCVIIALFVASVSFAQEEPSPQESQDTLIEQQEEKKEIKRVEKMPEFPGGNRELLKFIKQNIIYPKEAAQQGHTGTVIIQFVVNQEGKVRNPEVLKSSSCPALDQAAIDVIRNLPDFTPGMQDGKNVSVYYRVPIVFDLEKPKKTLFKRR